MEILTLDNLVYTIVKLVPEFKEYKDFKVWDINDSVERNALLGVFGRFFRERIENYPENDSVIQRVYKFMNEQINESKSDKDAVDYIAMEIFEEIASLEKGMILSRKLLKGKALESFNETAIYF